MNKSYLVAMTCAVSGNPIYLRNQSRIGNHMTYKREEAARFFKAEAKSIAKTDKRFRVEKETQ